MEEEYQRLISDIFHIRHKTTDRDWLRKASVLLDKYSNVEHTTAAVAECRKFVIDYIRQNFDKKYRIALTRDVCKQTINSPIHIIKGVRVMCTHVSPSHKGDPVFKICRIIID